MHNYAEKSLVEAVEMYKYTLFLVVLFVSYTYWLFIYLITIYLKLFIVKCIFIQLLNRFSFSINRLSYLIR